MKIPTQKTPTQSLPRHAAFVLAAAGLSSPAAVVHAAETERVQLEPMVVVATRYEKPTAVTAASVTVLEAEDLARDAARPLEEILLTQAGITVARTGGPGQQTSLFLRGNEGDSTLILVNGVKINGGTLGNAALQNLRGADIERVEIVRGPRSTLYGSEAVGGVISITTKRAQAESSATLTLGGGSDATQEARAGANLVSGETRLSASIGRYQTDADPVTTRSTFNGEHNNSSATLSASTLAGDTRLSLDAWNSQGRVRYALADFSNWPAVMVVPAHQDFDNGMIALGSETAVGSNQTLRARLGFAHDELDQRELNAFSPTLDYARTRRLVGGLEWHHRQGGNTLVAGLDAERESVQAQSYGTRVDNVNDNRAVFLRDDLRLDRHEFTLGARHSEYDSFGGHWTGEASYGLHADEQLFAWIAMSRGFRAPDTSERYGFGGNPLLRPESTENREIGLRRTITGGHQVTLTAFRQHIDDMIRTQAGTATNIASVHISGSELGWSWRNTSTRLDAMATLIAAKERPSGQRLLRRPEQQFSASAQHRIGNVTLRASALAMDPRDDFSYTATPARLEHFTTVDLGVNWQVHRTLSLDARVENVGDIAYALTSDPDLGDYRMPDRGYFLSVEWKP